jgi:hypothetical protein
MKRDVNVSCLIHFSDVSDVKMSPFKLTPFKLTAGLCREHINLRTLKMTERPKSFST